MMNELDLIIDLHMRNDRQGPGSDLETDRALALARLDNRDRLEIADFGCGTGAASLRLACTLDAHLTAIDMADAFITRLRERAAAAGLGDRIDARIGDMASPGFADESFDLIWSEGAIYNIGFAAGLRAWRPLLKPGGIVAVTEITWTTRDRPREVHEYWTREYPAISTATQNIAALEQAGYDPIGLFFLPQECWESNFYQPLESGFDAFLDRHDHSDLAKQIVAAGQAEMDLYRTHGDWYSYAFYIGRKSSSPDSLS